MEWKEMDKKRRGILLTVMLLTPVTAFYLMQLIMGTKFVDVKLMAVAANGLWLAGVYWLLCSFTGYPVMSSLVASMAQPRGEAKMHRGMAWWGHQGTPREGSMGTR